MILRAPNLLNLMALSWREDWFQRKDRQKHPLFAPLKTKTVDICVGLGNTLGRLLSREPSLVQTTAAARVLQLLMEQEEESISSTRDLAAYISNLGLEEHFLKGVKELDPRQGVSDCETD